MEEILSLSAVPFSWLDEDWANITMLCKEFGFTGVEIFAGTFTSAQLKLAPPGLIRGVHLSYPTTSWVPAWLGHSGEAGNTLCAEMLRHGQEELSWAKDLGVAYVVAHAAYTRWEDLLYPQTDYDDRAVITALLNYLRQLLANVTTPPRYLFENIWHAPGLRLDDWELLPLLLETSVQAQTGICIDTGHLLNIDHSIVTEQDALTALENAIPNFQTWLPRIEAVHLQLSLAGDFYRSGAKARLLDQIHAEPDEEARRRMCWDMLSREDQHRPWREVGLKNCLSILNPKYLIHELVPSSLEELKLWLDWQCTAVRR